MPRHLRTGQLAVALGLPLMMFAYAVLMMLVIQRSRAWPSQWLVLLGCAISIPFVVWFFAAVVYRLTSRAANLYRIQQAGFDICLKCGHWPRALDDATTSCPACGAKRESELRLDSDGS